MKWKDLASSGFQAVAELYGSELVGLTASYPCFNQTSSALFSIQYIRILWKVGFEERILLLKSKTENINTWTKHNPWGPLQQWHSVTLFLIPPKGPRNPDSSVTHYPLYCSNSFEIQNLWWNIREDSMDRVRPSAWLPFHSISRHQINSSPSFPPSSWPHWEQPLLGKKKHVMRLFLAAFNKKLHDRVLVRLGSGFSASGPRQVPGCAEEQQLQLN